MANYTMVCMESEGQVWKADRTFLKEEKLRNT